jgi:uncharacterized repeat protein (TIGR01451 family)
MVTVGLDPQNRVAYVSSSLSRVTTAPPSATLTPVAAWLKAADQLKANGVDIPTSNPGTPGVQDGWTVFGVPGTAQLQRARLGALSLPGKGIRPVFEVNVVDVGGGKSVAYTSYVDAITGSVLIRHNQVDNLAALPSMTNTAAPVTGTITATDCDSTNTFPVDAATQTVSALVSEVNPANDIVLTLKFDGATLTSSDTATSPEVATASLPGGHAAGTVTVQVCPFTDPTVPFTAPGNFVGTFSASEQALPSAGSNPDVRWKAFLSNPPVSYDPTQTLDTRTVECFFPGTGCGPVLDNLAARGPWDVDQRTDTPTFTTLGNAANTQDAWISPLTPGGFGQRPFSPDRFYGDDTKPLQDFTDAWNNTKCDPTTAFSPAQNNNDIQAAVTNLFAGHNRMHDFSYFLGFTEQNSNLQDDNFGLTDPSREHDVELGDVQAGALTGGAPSYEGRDNANQIALQDGVPGITNQYLFQPIAGAFYSPCVDGDFDTSVYGHEYTHAISNRMVGGPSDSLTGFQAGSMGESWSDQVALEYLFENGYSSGGASPWVEGPYVTSNKTTGIRNYALNHNPLQYGDLGYDVTGPEVHADGEVWSATMWDVRQALVSKYNGSFPESNQSLERSCANGNTTQQPPVAPKPATQCPGGRRWLQLTFDSFLLQNGATSMLDARDAYLAADLMRFGGANQTILWNAFASDGMGSKASTVDTDDDQPVSDYTSPVGPEGTLSITARGFSGGTSAPIEGKLYVGDYEARATPIADTDSSSSLPSTVKMVPGTYSFVFQSDGYGLYRFTEQITAGQTTGRSVHMSFNSASLTNGAAVDGSSSGLNQSSLIDDTEATNWAGTNPSGVNVDTAGQNPFVNVDLAGGLQVVRSVNVSAMLRPAGASDNDADSGSRFTALRKFAIEVCTEGGTSDCSSTLPSGAPGSPYKRIYTSPDNAFDAVKPRPLAPDLLFKRFDVPDTAATHVRLVALENQCTGQSQYAGEQDNDPSNATDCKTGSDRGESVRAAELEVFSYDATTRPPGDPVVALTGSGDAAASVGDTVGYTFSYRNLGPATSSGATIAIDKLPAGLSFVKASGNVTWDPTTRRVLWRLGDVAANKSGTVTLTAKVSSTAHNGDLLLSTAQFGGRSTYSPPAAVVTLVSPLSP